MSVANPETVVPESPGADSFPRRQAATRRFTLGAPRGVVVSPDGARVVFLRSRGGDDPVTCLWVLDVATREEHLLVDPLALDVPGEDDLPPEEKARRERVREQSGGVVDYATDRDVATAAFVLSGRAFTVGLTPGSTPTALAVEGPVVDPRPDPSGTRVGFVRGGALHVHALATGETTTLATPDAEHVTWGLADFVAAEEMNRYRGFWWAPDGAALAVARVDDAAVTRWYIADPANPDREPTAVAYPAAGTTNATVTLHLLGLDGARADVDLGGDEYLAAVDWDTHGLLVTTAPRDQKRVTLRAVDPSSGASTEVRSDVDDAWVDLVPGVPAHLSDGALVWCADVDDARRLVVDGEAVTGPELQVRGVADVDGDTVLFGASLAGAPTSTVLHVWSREAGVSPVSAERGVASGRLAGGVLVVAQASLDHDGTVTTVTGPGTSTSLRSVVESPRLEPRVHQFAAGERGLATAVLLPRHHIPGSERLPVLLDPYGGPHAQRVVDARGAYLTSQWFADQGFAVVVADGRGTPGRGPAFEREVHGDLALPVLEDQLAALAAAAAEVEDLDLSRVGIRGWSFGGYLAALAVLRRPDAVHAAVAGAPVTDWALYDTHYTERYLGTPSSWPDAYARSSIVADAERPATTAAPHRPLMLVHGLADDNVVAAHTLRLSSALLAAGRPHEVLPLSGVTHMTPQEVVAENLLRLQVAFLKESLGVG
ncbi:prolyl oligopeptidase family serine peptidase [Actinomycetospora sp. TBRC 11914]|uniref:prolyl oligopeptidase family serine peptidase n=1 Tax=Actinomycetospora sp. TBRC 11914 TaxID=2729387 RepID=UPI00145F7265|nr:prolyl oligopeptidase family serine peptidase [Actinomycetospora sp. TBRC 11914]NMO88649.1 prolyl oligopeptidase family serine peptidase [Actinomycetospora sp. TBRC 11914]